MKLDAETVGHIQQLGGDALVREIFETFLEHAPGRMQGVRAGIAAGDLVNAAKAAHSLRSSAVSLGGAETARLAAETERSLRDGDEAALPGRLAALERSFEELVQLLRRRVAEADPPDG